MKFDIYGRFQLEVLRDEDHWSVYRLASGKRMPVHDFVIPPDSRVLARTPGCSAQSRSGRDLMSSRQSSVADPAQSQTLGPAGNSPALSWGATHGIVRVTDLLTALRPEPIAQFAEISRTSTGEVRMDDHGSDVAEREVHTDVAAPLALRVVVVAMIVR